MTNPLENHKLVPLVADEAMQGAGAERIMREYAESDWEEAKDVAEGLNQNQVYDAMLSAYPDAPTEALREVVEALNDAKQTLALCTLLDKSGQAQKSADKAYAAISRLRAILGGKGDGNG